VIGVFDSGVGGLSALRELRRQSKDIDICFYADRDNAPYGTKEKDELIPLVMRDIDLLSDFGANRILMACCTASTVWDFLPKKYKECSVPIILPTAEMASRATKNGNIGVISTKRTRDSHAFKNALKKIDRSLNVTELCAQSFVGMAETGIYKKEEIENTLRPLSLAKIDTLILGCTHFSRLSEIISTIVGCDIRLIDSAKAGAEKILSEYCPCENGLTHFL
jgi:glutamate racemase